MGYVEARDYWIDGRLIRAGASQLRYVVDIGIEQVKPEHVLPFGSCYAFTHRGADWVVPASSVRVEVLWDGRWRRDVVPAIRPQLRVSSF